MEWVTDRKPFKSELEPVFKRDNYVVYGNIFLVWNGEKVYIDNFVIAPKEGGGYHNGYFSSNKIIAWMPLPAPPKEDEGHDK